MSALLQHLLEQKGRLKQTETKGGAVDLARALKTEPKEGQQDTVRNYFFQAGVDEWYNKLVEHTFRSEFISITKSDAEIIIKNWEDVASKTDAPCDIPLNMVGLIEKIDKVILEKFPSTEGVFVKLSTRSPKDSKTVMRKAEVAFQVSLSTLQDAELDDNARLVAFSDEMVKACAVKNGHEAVSILLDSWRVAEDLMYAFEEGKEEFPVSLVIRAWDRSITPRCEFRGFVWDRKLNCLGQYWHSLYFPELQSTEAQECISRDCLALFEKLKDSLPVPNAMLDLAWLGPGEVLLIEVNPLMEGLGSFKGSTGLFDFYADAALLTGGEVPNTVASSGHSGEVQSITVTGKQTEQPQFELRVRTEPESRASLISHMSHDWRRIVLGF